MTAAAHRGIHVLAGGFGHLVIDPDGERCGCGAQGCLETVISGSAVRRHWGRQVAAARSALAAAPGRLPVEVPR